MKDNLRRLNVILKMFPEGTFYVISIWDDEITLQSWTNENIISKARQLKFIESDEIDGWIHLIRGVFRIVLSPNR